MIKNFVITFYRFIVYRASMKVNDVVCPEIKQIKKNQINKWSAKKKRAKRGCFAFVLFLKWAVEFKKF